MDMGKETFEFLAHQAVTAAGKAVVDHGDDTFLISNDGVHRFKKDDAPQTLHVHTLTGLVEAIQTDVLEQTVASVHVQDANKVLVYGALDKFGNRPVLLEATPFTETMNFGHIYDQENFQISLRSRFVENEHRQILIEFAGNLVEKNEQNYTDDGFSQQATVKNGVASVAKAIVPSPVKLQPYRTFIEVEQPASEFIFRVQKGPEMGLFESDGNAWKNEAIKSVAAYLTTELPDVHIFA